MQLVEVSTSQCRIFDAYSANSTRLRLPLSLNTSCFIRQANRKPPKWSRGISSPKFEIDPLTCPKISISKCYKISTTNPGFTPESGGELGEARSSGNTPLAILPAASTALDPV